MASKRKIAGLSRPPRVQFLNAFVAEWFRADAHIDCQPCCQWEMREQIGILELRVLMRMGFYCSRARSLPDLFYVISDSQLMFFFRIIPLRCVLGGGDVGDLFRHVEMLRRNVRRFLRVILKVVNLEWRVGPRLDGNP